MKRPEAWPSFASLDLTLIAAVLAACSAPPLVSPGDCNAAVSASAACTHGPTEAPGGLSRDAAITAARRFAPSGGADALLVWVAPESNPFAPRPSVGSLVWEVRLAGSMSAAPCPSGFLDREPTMSDPPCLDRDAGLIVVLDFFSGTFLGWLH